MRQFVMRTPMNTKKEMKEIHRREIRLETCHTNNHNFFSLSLSCCFLLEFVFVFPLSSEGSRTLTRTPNNAGQRLHQLCLHIGSQLHDERQGEKRYISDVGKMDVHPRYQAMEILDELQHDISGERREG